VVSYQSCITELILTISMRDEPSRSYLNTKAMPIVTTYETYEQDPATDNASIKTTPVDKHKSVAGSTKAPTVKRGSVDEGSLRAPTVTRLPTSKPASVKAPSTKAATIKRPPSVAASVRNRDSTDDGGVAGAASGTGLGQVLTPQRQRELQQRNNVQPNNVHPLGPAGHSRTSLNDQGHVARDRNTTFDEPERAASPRPMSPFGHRPAPNLMSVAEDGRESRFDQRDRGGGMLNRNGTVISRANTMGRNGTLSRAQNGGTVGSRRGAFGRGAGASIGTQPEEVLGRE